MTATRSACVLERHRCPNHRKVNSQVRHTIGIPSSAK